MLKKISPLISPELLKILAEMGHGDVIAFGDANFPAESSKASYVVRADGIPIPALLDAVLELFPIDTFVVSGCSDKCMKVPANCKSLEKSYCQFNPIRVFLSSP